MACEYAQADYDNLRDQILEALRHGCKIEDGLLTVRVKEDLEIL